jgi:hypothetical protein
MSKRPPYLEIALTLAAMAFLALIVAGGIDAGTETYYAATMHLH